MLGTLININWVDLLSQPVQREVRGRMQRRFYRAGEVLHRKGDPATHLYELIDGKLNISFLTRDGREFWPVQFEAGDAFGEQGLIDGAPRANTIMAQVDSTVALLMRDDFEQLRSTHNEIERALSVVSVKYQRLADEFLEDLSTLDTSQRLAKLLCGLAARYGSGDGNTVTLDIGTSQEQIARMLYTSRQSVSKELHALRQQGIVETRREKLVIKDLAALQQLF
jgi:CRP/FNR family cyclic AMP-dependent transcriptional regulator